MLLSKAQKALLDMLRRVETMREDAARRLLLMAYPHTSWEPIVHQLECLGQIRRQHGFISRTDEEKTVPAAIETSSANRDEDPERGRCDIRSDAGRCQLSWQNEHRKRVPL